MQKTLSEITLIGGILDGEKLPSDNLTPLAYISVQERTDVYYDPDCLCIVEDKAEYVGAAVVIDPIQKWHTYQRSHRDAESGNWVFVPKVQTPKC